MFSIFNAQEKQIFIGNILFIACCVFYLAWWVLTFKPAGALDGAKTGWLLIPASLAGLLGVILILRSALAAARNAPLLPGVYILWGGLIGYFILLFVTVMLFKRPATSELILIAGWCMLALAEVNALYGAGMFPRGLSAGLFALIGAAVVISLVCYVLYFRLDSRAGYVDGMIPLLLVAVVMGVISCLMAIPRK